MQVLQGVILGMVLAVPVAVWAYQRGTTSSDETAVAQEQEARVVPKTAANARKAAAKARPQQRVKQTAGDFETIPASKMHTRIDDGTVNPPSTSQPALNE